MFISVVAIAISPYNDIARSCKAMGAVIIPNLDQHWERLIATLAIIRDELHARVTFC